MKVNLKQEKGITLIALVITIVVLLILAGVTIAMLTGENGILGKATTAKSKNDESSVEEKIKLSVMYARMNTNGDTNINLDELETELNKNFNNDVSIDKKGANEALPWKVTNNGYMFEITENGEVTRINGIALDKSNIKLLQGESETITAELTQGVSGTITWISEDSSIARVDSSGNVNAVGLGETTITAKIEGTEYSATCEVSIVAKVTSISLNKTELEIEQGATEELTATPTPSTNVENLKFLSNNEQVKVEEKGLVDEKGSVRVKITVDSDAEVDSTALITVQGEKTTTVTATCEVKVKLEDERNKIAGIIEKSKTEFANNNNIREVREGNIPIPVGYYYIKGTKKAGAVITDAENGGAGGNEFVWIPVKNIGEMAKPIDGTNDNNGNKKYRGVLYNFNSDKKQNSEIAWSTDSTSYREPANLSDMDEAGNVYGWTSTLYQEEYDKMVKQVEKYHGFYVGRYEMSLNSEGEAQSKGGETSANASADSDNKWYGLYTKAKTYAPDTQENTKSVVSSMIWGSQYDAMMRWMQGNGVDVTETPTDTPSSTLQNAVRNEGSTTGGENNKDVINNVYDLLGNRYEWTQEANSTDVRVILGGRYGRARSPSNRHDVGNPSAYDVSCGSRIVLYIK